MLDISSLQYNAENPNLITVIYTVFCALALGILITFTYSQTTGATSRKNHFMQALVLVTIVAATIIQAIGDSVARGLGMLGALSIIRFRTTVRDPRDIVFVFSAIAAGIACGVFGFLIAVVGTVVFCTTAFLLKYSAPSGKSNLKGVINLILPNESNVSRKEIEQILKSQTYSFQLRKDKLVTKGKKIEDRELGYTFTFDKGQSLAKMHEAIVELDIKVTSLRMDIPQT